MTLMRFARLLAVGALLGLTGQALAQGMETRQGSRHVGPGAVAQSASTFAVGLTRDNGATFVSSASVNDTVEIRGQIRPEPANVGQTADIFVVDRLVNANDGHISFAMRTASNVWVAWNGTVSLLVPFQEDVPLTANHQLTMFSGMLGTAGNHRIFLGYMASDGILRYHTSGLPITITEASTESPLVQAQALFSARIHANIVQNICTSCHVSGDPTTGGVHQFVQGSGQAQINANFQVFVGLMGRGKAYILDKVLGGAAHGGGPVLSQNSADYRDLEQFLTLLEQR